MRAVQMIAEAIRKIRREAELTQEELAEMAHCSKRSVQRLEAGEGVRAYVVERALKVLGYELRVELCRKAR